MMVPLYETAEHRRKEREVRRRLEYAWSCSISKPWNQTCVYDGRVTRAGKLIAFVEIKDHPYAIGSKYGGKCYFDESKIKPLLELKRKHGVPALFIHAYADGLLWIPVRVILRDWSHVRMYTGRTDRGDKNDVRWTYPIPLEAMTRVVEPEY